MSKGKGHQRGLPPVVYPQGVKDITVDLSKDELIRRLKVLARSFQDMEQGEEVSQFEPLALYLVNGGFFKHTSKEVKLLVACCIADIFRVFAPEAPYRTAEQLRFIFQFLNKQLWGLENVDGPSWKRYFYLLENIAMVKSFNICMELEDCNEIFVELFNVFFNIISEHHTPKVRTFMLDVMCPLISENDAVPPDLLETILANLLEGKKAENPHAFQMARELVKRTSTSIEPSIQAFFNNVLILGKTNETELAGNVYELISQLNTISSTLLQSVLPQLEFKLKSNDERERLAVTKLLGRMFSNKDSDLATQNKALWNCFLGRFSDISISIRIACAKFVQDFILHHAYLINDLMERLRERVHDTDESVRQEVVSAVVGAAKKDMSNISDEMLTLIKDRTLDKKWKIRKESVLGLAHIYKKWYNSDDLSTAERKRLTWIKDKVLHMYYQPIIDDLLLVERIYTMTLVPYTLDVKPRMRALLQLFATVDHHAVKALIEMLKNQHIVRTHVRELMATFRKEKAERAKLIHPKIVAISKFLPEPTKAVDHLKKLASVLEEDLKARAAMDKVVDPKVTCRRAAQSVAEVLKKLGSPTHATATYETVKTLMERIAPLVIDSHAIKELIGIVSEHVEGIAEPFEDRSDESTEVRGLKLLQTLAPVFPNAFRSEDSFSQLISMLKNDDDAVSDVALQIFTNTGENIKEEFPNVASCLLPILMSRAKTGTPSQAKHAIRCINVTLGSNRLPVFRQLYDSLQRCLSLDHEHHLTAMTAIGEIARLVPVQFCPRMKPIIANSIVKGLLILDQTQGTPTKGIWCHDNQVCEETLAKIAAIKLLVRWLEGLRKLNDTSPCLSTIRLLMTMIKNDGDLMERKAISKADMSRLRLAASCAMLKIAQVPGYHELIPIEHFQVLALTINDECFQVRECFARKLHKGLSCLRLPLSYMAIFSLSVKDPVKDSRANAKQYLIKNINNRREYLKQHTVENAHLLTLLPEYVLPYVIHLLAHDPDFTNLKDFDGLRDAKECMWFIMEPLVTKNENCSFLRKLVETIKQMKDAQNPDDRGINKKLYAVCDIALGLLMNKTPAFTQKEHPVKPMLPKQLFVKPRKPLLNTESSVLPKKMQEELIQEQNNSLTDKPVESAAPKGAKAGKKPQKAETNATTSPASPGVASKKTPRGDENKPAETTNNRRSSRTDSTKAEESKVTGRERKASTRSRGSALAENNANGSIQKSSVSSPSPKKPQRKRTVAQPIKEFLTRSKTGSLSSDSPASSPTKSPRKRPASQTRLNSPSPKKLRLKQSSAVKSAQTKLAKAKAARAKTLAVKKLKAAASPSSTSSPSKASSAKTTKKTNAGTLRAKSKLTGKTQKSPSTPVKKTYAVKSPSKKPVPSPAKKSASSPTKKAAPKITSNSANSNSSRSPVKKLTPKKTTGAKLTNGSISTPPKKTTLRRESLDNKLNQQPSRSPRPPSSPQSSPVRYSPRKSVLAGPLTVFQKRRIPSKPSPQKPSSPASGKTKELSTSSPSDRKAVKRKLANVDASGDRSSLSSAAPSPKKLKQTKLNFNLRKANRKDSSRGLNGSVTSDEDTNDSSGSTSRLSRRDRTLVRAIEAVGSKATLPQAQTSLSIRRSNRRRKH